jgi:hypothetical protein
LNQETVAELRGRSVVKAKVLWSTNEHVLVEKLDAHPVGIEELVQLG